MAKVKKKPAPKKHGTKLMPPEEMLCKIEEFIEHQEENGAPITIQGFAAAMGFRSKKTWYNYSHRPGYEEVFDYANMAAEKYAAEFLFTGKNIIGAIFTLKNFYGWMDKQEHDIGVTDELALLLRELDGKTGGLPRG